MAWKQTKLYSILNRKCPYCHEGEFFVSHPYDLAKAGDTHAQCPACKRKFSMEPGFYYGAMYVSYAIGVAVSVAVWVAFYVLWPTAGMWTVLGTIITTLLIGAPWFYATSKIIWANLFFHFDKAGATRD